MSHPHRTPQTNGVKRRRVRLRLDNLEPRLNPAHIWYDLPSPRTPAEADSVAYLHPDHARTLRLEFAELQPLLAAAPTEADHNAGTTAIELTLPAPDGTRPRFAVWQANVMAPELAVQFPNIRTYQGRGLDDPTATIRLDHTPQGFHAQVLSASGSWFIDPEFHLETDTYISYQRTALEFDDVYPSTAASEQRERSTADDQDDHDHDHDHAARDGEGGKSSGGGGGEAARSGSVLRTYRLAVAATGEYTQFHGGTVELGQAAIVTAINRINGIYERELSIRLQLIANNASLVYTNGIADPFSNGSSSTMLGQNQTLLDGIIGSANYDLGHVFGTAGGGVATVGSVGINGSKARGVTAIGNPVGDAFYVDYVAHELGHQFGAEHSFNTSSNGNRVAASAFEVGSGSTIMGYAGITGVNSDLQPNADPYFNSGAFDEIIEHVDQIIPTVGTRTATGNAVPTVDAGANYIIPAQTPFVLTAMGHDADGDALTYSWEQRDLGVGQLLTSTDNGTSPLFRVLNPTTDPSRTFPRLSDLVRNVNTIPLGEKLPTANRTAMKFRVTVRDNQAGGGGVNSDEMQVQVVNTGSPFAVTTPNTAETWLVGEQRAIMWNVAGTNLAPINASHVRITLSLDGGLTYPITLADDVPNNGLVTITVPTQPTTMARVRVQAANNIFFAISNVDFTIATTLPASQISGRVFEDWNGNGTFDSIDRGLAGQTLLFDRNNNGQQDTQTFSSGALNVAIPDANLTGVTRTISVTNMPTLADVNVLVNVNHARIGDLRLSLISPNNVRLPLILNRGSGGSNFLNTVLDDEATMAISAGSGTFSGSFVPDSYLGLLDGSNPNGTWALNVVDISNSRTGSLVNWSLTFPTELTATTTTDGSYRVQGLPTGSYRVVPTGTGFNTLAPANGFHTVTIANSSDTFTSRDFARSAANAIYGQAVFDANVNGVLDAGDTGFADVPIYRDSNNDGTYTDGEPRTTTDALGRYVLTQQPSGPALVRATLAGLQTLTFPAAGAITINLPNNTSLFNNDFGVSIGSPPTITSDGGGSNATIELPEGLTTATTVTATDADPNATLTFSITGGTDATHFTIDAATGHLRFITPPYAAIATDADSNSEYLVRVQVSDGLFTDTQELTVRVLASPNRAPVLTADPPPQLTPIPQGQISPTGDAVTLLVANRVFDPDFQALSGVAIVGTEGLWQFSTDDGTSWQTVTATPAAALLLRPTDRLRVVPSSNFIGTATVQYHAWDQTTDNTETYVDLTASGATGGQSAYSNTRATAQLRVGRTMPPIREDSRHHTGARVALLAQSFTDNDPRAKRGIAIVAASGIAGRWQYSADGQTWRTLPRVSLARAFLLTGNDRLRFVPDANHFGTAQLTYHAWDQTTGRRATFANLDQAGSRGGTTAFSDEYDVVFTSVTPINDRPQLDAGGQNLLTRVAPIDTEPSGDTVAQLLAAHTTDVDNTALGMAITAHHGLGRGEWQYRSVGGSWQPFPTLSVRQALLLRPDDEVRFRPQSGLIGEASFIYRVWDQTETTHDTTRSSAFSTTRERATVIIANSSEVNRAPTLNTNLGLTLSTIVEDSRPSGDRVSQLLNDGLAMNDADTNAVKGIAIVGFTGLERGRWQWSGNRRSWRTIMDVSDTRALLLSDRYWLRYVPNANETQAATVTFHAWDRSRGTAGQRANLTIDNLGEQSAFSTERTTATVTITPRNDAPTLDNTGHPVLPKPESIDPQGTTVASLIQPISKDIDGSTEMGLAVIGQRADFGTWEYRLEGDNFWQPVPRTVSIHAALLLRSTDRLRVRPNAGISGTAAIRFHAWDQSFGGGGEQLSLATSNAFSRANELAVMAYNNGNNRPLLNIAPTPTMPPNEPRTVASIVGQTITDPDPSAQQGLAIVGLTRTLGTWEFSTDDGITWHIFEMVGSQRALLLRPTDQLRFSTSITNGHARLRYHAWDQTSGQAGTYHSTTNALSLATETLTIHLNTAPIRNS